MKSQQASSDHNGLLVGRQPERQVFRLHVQALFAATPKYTMLSYLGDKRHLVRVRVNVAAQVAVTDKRLYGLAFVGQRGFDIPIWQ